MISLKDFRFSYQLIWVQSTNIKFSQTLGEIDLVPFIKDDSLI